MRKKRLLYNTITAILNQIVTLICGFILPRQILLAFGSDVNGLVSSATQFLGFVTLLDMGVGAVVQSALYLPLAKKDNAMISKIMIAAKKFFNKIAGILIIYTIVLMVYYPLMINNNLGNLSTALLVLAISISSIAQYFFGITNQLLLNADQKSYIQLILQSTVTLLNTLVSVILIKLQASIVIVKLVASCVLLLRPIFMAIYVKRHYNLDYKTEIDKDPLPQKWNAMAQHTATFIVDRTDIAVLTVLSTLSNVSIYYVYHLVVQGLYQAFVVMMTGLQSLLGDMYAKKENGKLESTYKSLEWIVHSMVVFLFSCTSVLILPFVKVYTFGITDANYLQPTFSIILTMAYAIYCLRGFYNILIKAVGDYKETQASAIIEAVLNISVSIILVKKYGLVGIAIGTLIAVLYREIYFIIYIHRRIIYTSYLITIKRVLIDICTSLLIYFSTIRFTMTSVSYFSWIVLAAKVCLVALLETGFINIIFETKMLKKAIQLIVLSKKDLHNSRG